MAKKKTEPDYIVKFYKIMGAFDKKNNEYLDEDKLEIIYLTIIYNDNEGEIYDIYVTDSPSLSEYLLIRIQYNVVMHENWEMEKHKVWYCPHTKERTTPQEIVQNICDDFGLDLKSESDSIIFDYSNCSLSFKVYNDG